MKKQKGEVQIDIVIGLILFVIGSISVMYAYSAIIKIKSAIIIHSTIVGYMTEICEEIDLESYERINQENRINQIITALNIPEQYTITYNIERNPQQDTVQKIKFNIRYKYPNTNKIRQFYIDKIKYKE